MKSSIFTLVGLAIKLSGARSSIIYCIIELQAIGKLFVVSPVCK